MRGARGDHHVVDRRRRVAEEPSERARVAGVERHCSLGVDLLRGGVESRTITPSEDHLCALGVCLSSGLEPNPGASTDHDDAFVPRG